MNNLRLNIEVRGTWLDRNKSTRYKSLSLSGTQGSRAVTESMIIPFNLHCRQQLSAFPTLPRLLEAFLSRLYGDLPHAIPPTSRLDSPALKAQWLRLYVLLLACRHRLCQRRGFHPNILIPISHVGDAKHRTRGVLSTSPTLG